MNVQSYGVGSKVTIASRNGPPVQFKFGTPYREIEEKLFENDDDKEYYKKQGFVKILERNKKIKNAPEKWQEVKKLHGVFDVVWCFEERIYDLLVEDINGRKPEENDDTRALHVISMHVDDNAQESEVAGQIVLEFCKKVNGFEPNELEEKIPPIVEDMSKKYQRAMTHWTTYV